MIDRKVDHQDYKTLIDEKMEKTEAKVQFAKSDDLYSIRMQIDEIYKQIDNKLNREQFIALDMQVQDKVSDILKQLSRKSNIKDVCALVDTKASSCDVFKVLDEMKKSI